MLPTCDPHGNICSFSDLAHQNGRQRPPKSARAARNLSYPWASARLDCFLVPQCLGTGRPGISMEVLPPFNQLLNTGTQGASYSDAADHLQLFEALDVSHSLHGETEYQ